MSHEQNLASMRRFGEEVMPAFQTEPKIFEISQSAGLGKLVSRVTEDRGYSDAIVRIG